MIAVNRRRVMGGESEPVDIYANMYLTMYLTQRTRIRINNPTYYSLDNGETWTSLASSTNTPYIDAGNTIMWKAELTPDSSKGSGRFLPENSGVKVYGNPMSLLFGDNFVGVKSLDGYDYAFKQMFYSSNFSDIENVSLPATVLSQRCYTNMFREVTAKKPPKLPAKYVPTEAYYGMFYGSALEEMPALPATTLDSSAYREMFYGCTSLITAVPVLPATTLGLNCCQEMFRGCTSLTTSPTLPATTLTNNCYVRMFMECTSLVKAPELPSLTLASQCYSNMFNGCSSLNYIKAMFTTTPSTTYTKDWVSGVAATGTFVKNSAAQWNVTGVNGVPSGWTVQTASE